MVQDQVVMDPKALVGAAVIPDDVGQVPGAGFQQYLESVVPVRVQLDPTHLQVNALEVLYFVLLTEWFFGNLCVHDFSSF